MNGRGKGCRGVCVGEVCLLLFASVSSCASFASAQARQGRKWSRGAAETARIKGKRRKWATVVG